MKVRYRIKITTNLKGLVEYWPQRREVWSWLLWCDLNKKTVHYKSYYESVGSRQAALECIDRDFEYRKNDIMKSIEFEYITKTI